MKAVQFTFLLLVSYRFESSKYHNFIFLVVLVFLYCFFFGGGGGVLVFALLFLFLKICLWDNASGAFPL